MQQPPVDAFILAGGRSTRFGSNKARFLIDGTPMIRHIADLLSLRFQSVSVVSKIADEYADLGLATLADTSDLQAPISGLLSALSTAATEWIFVTPCDTPDLTAQAIDRLWSSRSELGAVPEIGGQLHPLTAYYHRSATKLFATAMTEGRYALHDILSQSNVARVRFEDDGPFRNINLPDDIT